MLNTTWQMMLVALAGWVNEQQLAVIEYLKEENRVHHAWAPRPSFPALVQGAHQARLWASY